ncbi:MAG TPA: hypothetical protein ENK02_09505 [Planctomycetes bacterium]|nr:hypothetical protein [Planctomycetota bacterium]
MSPLSFTHPWFLLLLLLQPLLFWRPRRNLAPLDSDRLVLWSKALEQLGGGRGKARFLPRVLHSLIFSVLVLGAAGPVRPEVPGVHRLWQVWDASPSMALRTGPEETRWSRARARAEALSQGRPQAIPSRAFRLDASHLSPMGDSHSLSQGSGIAAPGVPLPSATKAEQVGKAMGDTHSMSQGGRIAAPGVLLPFAAQADEETAVVFWGDGAGPSPWPEGGTGRLFFGAAPLGEVQDLGFRQVRLEDPWPDREVLLRFRWVGGTKAPLRLRRGEGAWVDLPDPRLEKGGAWVLRIPREQGGALELALKKGDSFPLDDRLRLWLRPPPRLRLRSIPKGRATALLDFLRDRCLPKTPKVKDTFPSEWEVQVRVGGRLPPRPRLPGAGPDPRMGVPLCLGTQVGEGQRLGEAKGGLDWLREDPLLKGLDLSGYVPRRLLKGPLPAGYRVLAWLGKDPLLVVNEGRRVLAFLGTLPREGLFRQPFFPILCLRFLRRVLDDGRESRLAPLPPEREYAPARALEARPIPPERAAGRIAFFEPERRYEGDLALLALVLLGMALMRAFYALGPRGASSRS